MVEPLPLPNHPPAWSNLPVGWTGHFNTIVAALDDLAPGQWTCTQVKQKAGLRFYFRLSDGVPAETARQIREIVTAAEESTLSVCEICGQQAVLRKANPYWWRTLCDAHEGSMDEVDAPLRVRGDSDE